MKNKLDEGKILHYAFLMWTTVSHLSFFDFNFLMRTAYYARLDENYKLFPVLEVIMLSMSGHINRNVIRYN